MRVTNSMLVNNFLSDMKTNLNNMSTLQSQLSSGKQISKPSDDPFRAARSMQLNSTITANTQYNKNIKDTENYLSTADTALSQAETALQRIRELLVSSGNPAYETDEKQAISSEITQNIAQLSQTINTDFDGNYIFGGTRGAAKPMNNDCSYNVDTTEPTHSNQLNMIKSSLSTEISQGVEIKYNVSAADIMNFSNSKGDTVDLKGLLDRIVTHLDGKPDETTASASLVNEDLQGITDSINNVLRIRTQVGANQNRMESAQSKNEDENYNLTDILSSVEDIDITQKIMEFSTAQTVYTASLQTSAKVIQKTLLDYL